MVSQDSPPHPSSNIRHQSHFSDSITNQNQFQNQFETQHFDDAYGSTYRNSVSFPQSLGLLPSIQSLEERMSRSVDLVQAPTVAGESEMSNTRHLIDLFGTPNHSNHPTQRLSLSLGSDMLVPSVHYTHRSFNSNLVCPNYLNSSEDQSREACNQVLERVSDNYSYPGSAVASSSNALNRTSLTLYGEESLANAIGRSRFLKPAQSLLEEIVRVGGKAVELSNEKYVVKLTRGGRRGSMSLASELKAELCSTGLISVEKHELQVKIAKLIALLEEVEGRFEKYYHQMQEVMISFEMIAGSGSAKSYTALALQAMSRHFCSLRDSIVSQIKLEKRKQISDFPKISTGLSQLSLFDKDSRHNRTTLQQLGLMQSQRQVWRPIRGLPENSVSILRAWLFEHFLHPYPNDSEKLMLASQTGLTKNQVSNWFINARVRLWKPMIEEMYKEEFGDSSEDSNPLAGGNIEHEED